jgi:uncharacterized protein YcfL
MKKFILIMTVFLICGCQSTKSFIPNYNVPDADLMTKCSNIEKIKDSKLQSTVNSHINLIKQYKECSDKQSDLVDFIIKDKNIKLIKSK